MERWNLIGLYILGIACVFAVIDSGSPIFLLVFFIGVFLWLIYKRLLWVETVKFSCLFIWTLYWGAMSAGTFFTAFFAAVSMELAIFWHFYLYIAVSLIFAFLAISNLIVLFVEFKHLLEVSKRKTSA